MILRIRRFDENGDPEPVELAKAEIKRLEVFDHRCWDDGWRPVGRDRRTGEVYLLEPTGEDSREPERRPDTGRGRSGPRRNERQGARSFRPGRYSGCKGSSGSGPSGGRDRDTGLGASRRSSSGLGSDTGAQREGAGESCGRVYHGSSGPLPGTARGVKAGVGVELAAKRGAEGVNPQGERAVEGSPLPGFERVEPEPKRARVSKSDWPVL